MSATPITKLHLYEAPFDPKYKNVTDFGNESERETYLSSLPNRFFSDLYYIRKDAFVDVPISFDESEKYNYAVYDNAEGLGNQYAFILDREFLSFEATRLYIKTDVWQTYLFKMFLPQNFVEREHQDRFNKDGSPIFNLNPDAPIEGNNLTDIRVLFDNFKSSVVQEGGDAQ